MTAADALRELAKELRKGSGAASTSKDWNNGYLAGMEEAAKQAEKAAAALDGPPTYLGIPVVYNAGMKPNEVRLYYINTQTAGAVLRAGYEAALVRTNAPK